MQLLYEEHGVLHGPCPSCPGTDGLQADWSPDRMNFVNPPFSSAKQWLQKAADETLNSVVSIVLVPFRLHTRYMWHTLQYAASLCIISKPVFFQSPDGIRFPKPLPTPVCLVSFGSDVAPQPCFTIRNTHAVRLRCEDATVESVIQHVQERTGGACSLYTPPGLSCSQDAVSSGTQAVLCPARVANAPVQHLIQTAHCVVFLSPPLKPQRAQKRWAEGSLIVFFTNADAFLSDKRSYPVQLHMLNP